MQPLTRMEALRQRWEDYRPTKTLAFWLVAGAIVATLIIGFGPGGWVTGGSAKKMVDEAATSARHELAAAVCVEEFMGAENASTRLAKLNEASWYERGELLSKAGWATMPDRQEPNSVVATLCASKLSEMKAPEPAKGLTPTSAKKES